MGDEDFGFDFGFGDEGGAQNGSGGDAELPTAPAASSGVEEEELGFGSDFGADFGADPEPAQAPPASSFESAAPPREAPSSSSGGGGGGNGGDDANTSTSSWSQPAPKIVDPTDVDRTQIKPERSGWLRVVEPKKTLSLKGNIKERWFVLKPTEFSFSTTVTSAPIAVIPLNEIRGVDEEKDGDGRSFQIITQKRKIFLTARTAQECKTWVLCFREAFKSNSLRRASVSGMALLF